MAGERKRAGRPWAAARGSCVEINQLVAVVRSWLGESGVSVRELHARLTPEHFIARAVPELRRLRDRLSGESLEWDLVEAVADVCFPHEQADLSRRRLGEAKTLWDRAATNPTTITEAQELVPARELLEAKDRTIEVLQEMQRARQAYEAGERGRQQALSIATLLFVMLGQAQAKVAELRRRLDALESVTVELPDGQGVVELLSRAQRQETELREQLVRAERERGVAQQVADHAARRIHELEAELAELRLRMGEDGPSRTQEPTPLLSPPDLHTLSPDDAALIDVDRALEKARAVLDEEHEAVQQAADEVGYWSSSIPSASPAETGVSVPGQVRQNLGRQPFELSGTTPNNPPTSQETTFPTLEYPRPPAADPEGGISEAARRITQGRDPEDIVTRLCRAVVPTVADAVMVYLRDPIPVGDEEQVGPLVLRLQQVHPLHAGEGAALCEVRPGSSLLEVLNGALPVATDSPVGAAALPELLGEGHETTSGGHTLLVPLHGRKRIIGTAVLLRHPAEQAFQDADLSVAAEFATHSALAIDKSHNLQAAVQGLHLARSLADTLQIVANGLVTGLGYELACVNLVQPDGDLVVASFVGNPATEALITGRTGSRTSWERRLAMGEAWGDLRFIPHTEGWVLDNDDVPQWYTDGPAPRFEDEWHPSDRLFAPMYTRSASGASHRELLGVISVDRPLTRRRPRPEERRDLEEYAFQAAIAINNARLRANMQRALVRQEREQQALRASEESFRQAFEYAPSGMAISEMGGDHHGRILRTNDALCRLLGRPASALRRYSFSDLVHPEDIGTLLRTGAEGGRAELRLARRDGTYLWVSLRNSVVADALDGPRFLLTHLEDIEERKRREFDLAHRASHDALTGLPNSAGLHARIDARLCALQERGADATMEGVDDLYLGHADLDALPHTHVRAPVGDNNTHGLAVVFLALRDFKAINTRFGRDAGDSVLVEVAGRLSQAVRDGDTVARYGGDEFVVLADGFGPADAQTAAVWMQSQIHLPIPLGDQAVRMHAGVGIAWAQCGTAPGDILRTARGFAS
ncbi:diguanylate cyclase [Streptomyces phaeochromogenes]|nr:diguanylate cyclase [Streptomyces phaeochromogenes]